MSWCRPRASRSRAIGLRCGTVTTEMPLQGLRVLHFGHFDPEYSRNRIVAKALRRAGADVRIVTDPRPFAQRTPVLVRDALRGEVDLVLVGFPGHADVATAKAIATVRRAPVIFDAFVSLQETAEDRDRMKGAAHRRRLELEDRLACRLADRILVDTAAHGEHFATDLRAPRNKLRRLWVGADDDVMQPRSMEPHEGFRVFVYASFIPLHGLEHVVRAAALLEARDFEVTIDIVGDGDTAKSVHRLAAELGVHSVHFLGTSSVRRASRADGEGRRVPRHLRHVGEGATGDPEQGVRRAGVCTAGDHGGHACDPRAAPARRER